MFPFFFDTGGETSQVSMHCGGICFWKIQVELREEDRCCCLSTHEVEERSKKSINVKLYIYVGQVRYFVYERFLAGTVCMKQDISVA